jgi:hypothetical protein
MKMPSVATAAASVLAAQRALAAPTPQPQTSIVTLDGKPVARFENVGKNGFADDALAREGAAQCSGELDLTVTRQQFPEIDSVFTHSPIRDTQLVVAPPLDGRTARVATCLESVMRQRDAAIQHGKDGDAMFKAMMIFVGVFGGIPAVAVAVMGADLLLAKCGLDVGEAPRSAGGGIANAGRAVGNTFARATSNDVVDERSPLIA